MSTKRKATTVTAAGAPAKKSSSSNAEQQKNKLLGNMMQHLLVKGNEAVSFKRSATDLDFFIRTKSWVQTWKDLIEDGFIEPCSPGAPVTTGDHKLTQKGKDHASTPEYKELMKEAAFQPTTNDELHTRIKKRLVNKKGVEIFDLLLQHGSLNRKEICGIMGVKSGTHSFSYALKELKDKQFVEVNTSRNKRGDQKLRLADSCFLPDERPEVEETPQGDIDKLVGEKQKDSGRAKKKKAGAKSSDSNVEEKPTKKKQKPKETVNEDAGQHSGDEVSVDGAEVEDVKDEAD